MKKPTILLLGVHHFSGEDNGDLFITEQDNVLSADRQGEVEKITASLKSFKPTKVAVEVLHKHEETLNRQYISYLNDAYSLTVNEVEQVGFRLAKACGLERLHTVDWNEDIEGVPDLFQLSNSEDSDAFSILVAEAEKTFEKMNNYLRDHTLKEFLLWLNRTENVSEFHQWYMNLTLLDNPAGAQWTAHYWYYRNLLIYKNLIELIESEEERIFVMYGAGHLHLLLQFLKESGRVKIEKVEDYLM